MNFVDECFVLQSAPCQIVPGTLEAKVLQMFVLPSNKLFDLGSVQ